MAQEPEQRPPLPPAPPLRGAAPTPFGPSWPWMVEGDEGTFVRRVLIVFAIAALALLLWRLADVALLAFGAVVVAVILRSFADLIAGYTPVPRRWSLAAAGLLILVGVVAVGLLFGAQMRAQFRELAQVLPPAMEYVLGELGVNLADLSQRLPQMIGSGFSREVVGRVAALGMTFIGAVGDLILVVVAGVFLAGNPDLYKKGFVKLFPPSQHERIEGALDASGAALGLWLKGQLIAMGIVGVLTGAALWLIGLPSPLALGLFAGLGEFIPFIGPILAALPALAIAATQGTDLLIWTGAAFLVIQQLESNMVYPLVQRRTVSLPPALALFAVLAAAVVFGPLGFVLGVPLTVVAYVMVKKLYVRETLGETTEVPGEDVSGAPPPVRRGAAP